MGSPESEHHQKLDEFQHPARVNQPVYLGADEVTRSQFAAFVEATSYKTDAERDGGGGRYYADRTSGDIVQLPRFTWREPGFPQQDNHPVVQVSWNDAQAFCAWLS